MWNRLCNFVTLIIMFLCTTTNKGCETESGQAWLAENHERSSKKGSTSLP